MGNPVLASVWITEKNIYPKIKYENSNLQARSKASGAFYIYCKLNSFHVGCGMSSYDNVKISK